MANETSGAGSVTRPQKTLVSYKSDLFSIIFVIAILSGVVAFHLLFNPRSLIVFIAELLILSFGIYWCFLSLAKILGIVARRRPFSYCLYSLVIFFLLFGGISSAEIVQESADDILLLACELLCETGPDFPKAIYSNDLIGTFSTYSKFFEEKHIPAFLRSFTDIPAKGITVAKNIITGVQNSQEQDKVANGIWRAGEEVMLAQYNAPKFLPIRTPFYKPRPAPAWLLEEIRVALGRSAKALEEAEKSPTLDNKITLCEANRSSMLLLFLARNKIHNNLFLEFQNIIESSKNIDVQMDPAMNDKGDVDLIAKIQSFSDIIDRSEDRRSMVLAAILDQDMTLASNYLWDAMRESYIRRNNLMSLCNDVVK